MPPPPRAARKACSRSKKRCSSAKRAELISAALTLAATAFAVAMDAVAVSISSGMSRGRASWREALAMAGVFGVFQAIMPALGYVGGAFFRDAIEAYDHWVAFALLAGVGGHMILESRSADGGERSARSNPFAARSLLVLGLATSVDALAVGLSLAIIEVPPLAAILVIGAVTFALCVPAVRLGARLGTAFAHRAELAGGAILIALGVKILIEHLSGAA